MTTLKKLVNKGGNQKEAIHEMQQKIIRGEIGDGGGSTEGGASTITHTITTAYPATAPYIVGSNGEDVLLVDPLAVYPSNIAMTDAFLDANPTTGIFLLLPETASKQVTIMQISRYDSLVCIVCPPSRSFTGLNTVTETVTVDGVATSVAAFWLRARMNQVTMYLSNEGASSRWGIVATVDGVRSPSHNGMGSGGNYTKNNPPNERERRQNLCTFILGHDQYVGLTQGNNADLLHVHAPVSAGSATAMVDLVTLVGALRAAGYLTE